MKTIGFDLDGVLYDFHRIVYNHLVSHHNLKQNYSYFWGVGHTQYSSTFWDNFIRLPIMYEKAPIKSSDLAVLLALSKEYNLVYITQRPNDVISVSKYWMKENKIPQRSNLYFTSNSKVALVVKNQCDYFIDDNFKVIEELENYTNSILFKRDWHTKEQLNSFVFIKDLTELLESAL